MTFIIYNTCIYNRPKVVSISGFSGEYLKECIKTLIYIPLLVKISYRCRWDFIQGMADITDSHVFLLNESCYSDAENMFYVQVFYTVIAFLFSYFVVENFGKNEY